MRIILAGGSGFLGSALRIALRSAGHSTAILTRKPRAGATDEIAWTPDGSVGAWAQAIDGADAVVNLAGEGIADKRWSDERKRALRLSRVLSTRSVVSAMRQASKPPSVLVSASGKDYYGPHGDEVVTELTPPGHDFLSELCVEWEREAEQASSVTRVALVRSGLVLHPEGGALGSLLLPFRLGLGGPLGSGRQYMSWIERSDWVRLVVWLLENGTARGAFNATAPVPVTNAEFTRTLGRVLHRPAFIPVPGFGLRVILGEIADSLLAGQRAIPARALEHGFSFHYTELDMAFRDLL